MSVLEEYNYIKNLKDNNQIKKILISFSDNEKVNLLKYCFTKKDYDLVEKIVDFNIEEDLFISNVFFNKDLLNNDFLMDYILKNKECYSFIRNAFEHFDCMNYGCKNINSDKLFIMLINNKNFINLREIENLLLRMSSSTKKDNYYIIEIAKNKNMECSSVLKRTMENNQLKLAENLFPYTNIDKFKSIMLLNYNISINYKSVLGDFEYYASGQKLKSKINEELSEEISNSSNKQKRKI